MNTLKWTKEKPKIEDIGENLLLIADDYGNYYNYKLFIISKMDGDLYLCDHFGELWGDYEEDLNADMYAVIEKIK